MTDSDPAMFRSSSVRVGTAERERAAAALGEHFAAGRLEVGEYDERVGRAYAAKTEADLALLFTDLPRPVVAPPLARPARPPRSLAPMVVMVAVVLAVVVVATTHIVPFFVFPVLFFVFMRGRRGWGQGYRGPYARYRRM